MEKQIWFKNKTLGWGWTPANVRGWSVTLGFVVGVMIYPTLARMGYVTYSMEAFLGATLMLTVLLVFLAFKKGEKPQWNWGHKK